MSVGNTTFGHFVGGITPAMPLSTNKYHRLDYSTDTLSNSINYATWDIADGASLSDRVRSAYFTAGDIGRYSVDAKIVKLKFFTQTFSLISTTYLTKVAGQYAFGADGGSDKGYVIGGVVFPENPYNISNSFGKITYSTDTPSAVGSNFPEICAKGVSSSNFTSAAYCMPGFNDYSGYVSSVSCYKITFASDTTSSVPTAALTTARSGVSSLYNNDVFAYFSGGITSGSAVASSNVTDKLVFSTETTAVLSSAQLIVPLYTAESSSSNLAGYILGGIDKTKPYPSLSAICQKIDFATDTIALSVSASLSLPSSSGGAASQSYGFVENTGSGEVSVYGESPSGISLIRFDTNGLIFIDGGYGAKQKIFYSGTGSTTFDGSAIAYQYWLKNYLGSGSATLTGNAPAKGPVYGQGGVLLSGAATFKVDYKYIAFGSITLSNSTPSSPIYPYSGSGSLSLSGSVSPILDYQVNVSKALTYAILAKVEKDLSVNYAVGQVTTYGYRVESDCTFVNGQTCTARYINLVFATSVEGVCTELTRQGWRYRIKSLKKYSKPAYKSEELTLIEKGLYNPNEVPEYVEVPFCQEPSCYDFCIQYLVEERSAKLVMYGGTGPSFVVGSGTAYTYGSALVRLKSKLRKYYPTGLKAVSLGGNAVVTTTSVKVTTRYTGHGVIVLYGTNQITNDLGTITTNARGTMYLEEYTPAYTTPSNFEITTGQTIEPQGSSTNINQCNCLQLSKRLSLETNIIKNSDFSSFLTRNGYVFDESLVCYYDDYSASYNFSSHYSGIGIESSGLSTGESRPESWNLAVDINCANDLDNFDEDKIWILNLYIQRNAKYTYNIAKSLDCNLQVWIPSAYFCPLNRNRQITFNLEINVKTKTCLVNGSFLLPNIFINDQIGFFNSIGWLSGPIFTIIGKSVL